MRDDLKGQMITPELLERCMEYVPSRDPAYWARAACSVCWGKGFHHLTLTRKVKGGEGVETAKGEQWCACAKRGVTRWAREWLRTQVSKGGMSSVLGPDGRPVLSTSGE